MSSETARRGRKDRQQSRRQGEQHIYGRGIIWLGLFYLFVYQISMDLLNKNTEVLGDSSVSIKV